MLIVSDVCVPAIEKVEKNTRSPRKKYCAPEAVKMELARALIVTFPFDGSLFCLYLRVYKSKGIKNSGQDVYRTGYLKYEIECEASQSSIKPRDHNFQCKAYVSYLTMIMRLLILCEYSRRYRISVGQSSHLHVVHFKRNEMIFSPG